MNFVELRVKCKRDWSLLRRWFYVILKPHPENPDSRSHRSNQAIDIAQKWQLRLYIEPSVEKPFESVTKISAIQYLHECIWKRFCLTEWQNPPSISTLSKNHPPALTHILETTNHQLSPSSSTTCEFVDQRFWINEVIDVWRTWRRKQKTLEKFKRRLTIFFAVRSFILFNG